jgi:hypothetical protein
VNTAIDASAADVAAVVAVPPDARCPTCGGFGWRIYAWGVRRIPYVWGYAPWGYGTHYEMARERRVCATCAGSGRRQGAAGEREEAA